MPCMGQAHTSAALWPERQLVIRNPRLLPVFGEVDSMDCKPLAALNPRDKRGVSVRGEAVPASRVVAQVLGLDGDAPAA